MLNRKIFKNLKSGKIKNLIIYGFGQAVNLISPLLVLPYIVSICGEERLGKTGVGFSFALITIVLVDYGSYINGTRQVSLNTDKIEILEQNFITIYSSKLILLLTVLLFSFLIVIIVPFFERDKLQILLSLLIVVGQFINPTWFFQGIQNFKWISIINIVSKVIYIILVFVFIKTKNDYIYLNAFLGIGSIVASAFGFLWIKNKYNFSFKNTSFSKVKSLLKVEFSLTVSQLFFSLYQYAPILLISYVCGDFLAGQYRIIDQIVMVFRTYLQMFFNFIYADVCQKIFQNPKKGLQNWKFSNGLNYLLILLFLTLFYFNTTAILSFFKVNSTNIHALIYYFKLGLLIPVFMGITFALKQLMFSFDENKKYIKITIIATVLNLILMLLMLGSIGLKGSFLSIMIMECIIIISYLAVLKKHFKLNK